MKTTYAVTEKFAMPGTNGFEGYPLKARSDRKAREEAKRVAAERGWPDYQIEFFRESDGCRGTIDH